jgi:hypothetical protein
MRSILEYSTQRRLSIYPIVSSVEPNDSINEVLEEVTKKEVEALWDDKKYYLAFEIMLKASEKSHINRYGFEILSGILKRSTRDASIELLK